LPKNYFEAFSTSWGMGSRILSALPSITLAKSTTPRFPRTLRRPLTSATGLQGGCGHPWDSELCISSYPVRRCHLECTGGNPTIRDRQELKTLERSRCSVPTRALSAAFVMRSLRPIIPSRKRTREPD